MAHRHRLRQRLRETLREHLARVKAWLDVHILGTKPRFLGKRIQI